LFYTTAVHFVAATMTARANTNKGKRQQSASKKGSKPVARTQTRKIVNPPLDDVSEGESSATSNVSPIDNKRKQVSMSEDKFPAKHAARRSDSLTKDEDGDVEEKTENDAFFSDKNASWLKPKISKSKLLESDDEDSPDEDGGDSKESSNEDADDDDDDDELLDVEKDAQLIDEEMEAEEEDADEEMRRTIRENTAIYHLPTAEELEKNVDRVVPPSEVRSHIDSILEVLSEFSARREPGRARKEYIDLLGMYIADLYGYIPELIEYFLTMFSPAECLEFVDASDKPRPLVIRANTLKTRRKDLAAALMKRGVTLDPLAAWSKVGLKIIESQVPIGATPEYLSGMYMLQSAASMCPVLALAPEPKERVLDMAAAPGGKTSYIAQLMRNTGVVFANDLKADRQKATVANMHRLGVKNVIACKQDGRKLGVLFKNRFDRILLDAPCSGLGVISRDPSVKVQRTIEELNQCSHLQKELLLSAIDALKCKGTTGGVMVYSTCSVAVVENEEVVNYALSKRDIRIVETGLDFGTPGFTRYQQKRFHPSLALTRRFYPHVHNMDGFYVCKIQKLSDNRPGVPSGPDQALAVDDVVEVASNKGQQMAQPEPRNPKSKGGKKRKQRDDSAKLDTAMKSKVSVPPNRQPRKKSKKSSTSSKV
jgi:ribosomal RNA methyltransferase Nop2